MMKSLFVVSICVLLVIAALAPLVSAGCPRTSTKACVSTAVEGTIIENFSFLYDTTTGSICGLYTGPSNPQAITQIGTDIYLTPKLLSTSRKVDGMSTTQQYTVTTPENYHLSIGLTGNDGKGNSISWIIDATVVNGVVDMLHSTFYVVGTTITATSASVSYLFVAPACPSVTGDPWFVGFRGQKYNVKGAPDQVFNLLSTTELQLNSRFIRLAQNKSMTDQQMEAVRSRHTRLITDIKTGETSSAFVPPATVGWSHRGIYMGEMGLKVGSSQLYVAPGAYQLGFSTVTLDGAAVPVSDTPIEVGGSVKVTRSSPFTLDVMMSEVRFSIVNADHFLNIQHAALLENSADLSGLLGESAHENWKAETSSDEWRRHVEEDFKLASGDVFGNDFPANK